MSQLDRRTLLRGALALSALSALPACGGCSSGPRTGLQGVVAIDKIGGVVHLLDPETLAVRRTLRDFPPNPHELLIDEARRLAYVPSYGAGIYGDNAEPGHTISVIDLGTEEIVRRIDTRPYFAPHTMRFGPDGLIYATADASARVIVIDLEAGAVVRAIETGSTGSHRLALLPGGSKLYTENEDDVPFASVVDPAAGTIVGRIPMPNGTAGLGLSPDGRTLVFTDRSGPTLRVVDTGSDAVTQTVALTGLTKAAQIVHWAPEGDLMVVTSNEEDAVVLFAGGPDGTQTVLTDVSSPMDVAFHPAGRLMLVANQGDGSVSVVDRAERAVVRRVPIGEGIETLGYYGSA